MARRRGSGGSGNSGGSPGGGGRRQGAPPGTHRGTPGARIISKIISKGFPSSRPPGGNPRAPAPGGRRGAPQEHPTRIKRQKQDEHLPGTAAYRNRKAQGRQGSSWAGDERFANQHTYEAWYRGTPNPARPEQRDYDFGYPVGHNQRGQPQTRVRVHMDQDGEIHGHPR
ncbi:hypothetical protein ACIA8K_27910 [Catenuloplanes sp. NPDC051500]|uniref:hypothetical protein n=1 Tax=Catenuloplanes sp. NPDC051500 TaxID=3363959 RepID=UPI0037AE6EAC